METKTAIISIDDLKSDDLPGVQSLDFSLERKVAVIDFDPKQSNLDDFLRAVLKAGFRVS